MHWVAFECIRLPLVNQYLTIAIACTNTPYYSDKIPDSGPEYMLISTYKLARILRNRSKNTLIRRNGATYALFSSTQAIPVSLENTSQQRSTDIDAYKNATNPSQDIHPWVHLGFSLRKSEYINYIAGTCAHLINHLIGTISQCRIQSQCLVLHRIINISHWGIKDHSDSCYLHQSHGSTNSCSQLAWYK